MWRESKLFIYGWLPIRLLATGLALLGVGILWLGAYLQWLRVDRANAIVSEVF